MSTIPVLGLDPPNAFSSRLFGRFSRTGATFPVVNPFLCPSREFTRFPARSFGPKGGEMRSVDFPSWPVVALRWLLGEETKGAPPCESNHSAESNEAAAVLVVSLNHTKKPRPPRHLDPRSRRDPHQQSAQRLCVFRGLSRPRGTTRKPTFSPRQGVEKTHLGRTGSRQVKNPLAHRVLRFGRRGSSSIG